MLTAAEGLVVLGPQDLDEVSDLLAEAPDENCFLDYRARSTRMDPAWLGGQIWGWRERGLLVAVCHAGANLVPSAHLTEDAATGFARRALGPGSKRSDAVFGPRADVELLWGELGRRWSRQVREYRWSQPLLTLDDAPTVTPDPAVRRSRQADFDALYPACVAMSTEEVGVSPEAGGGGAVYRARVAQLVERGWSFVRTEGGRVVFKAEVAAATPHACQVQGVWVAPDWRGRGLAGPAMAAVVEMALADVAPRVTLYVNDFNTAARRTYAAVGFREVGTYSTVMF